ncbi:MAG TPA: hypothetical protein VD963_09965 [Phycisphaerales bacterium]|nr:hypothetical protein [Phycisphaerales bacterium]
MRSKHMAWLGLAAGLALGGTATAQDVVWDTGVNHPVLFNGTLTNLGLSSGNLGAGLEQRWFAMPFRVTGGTPNTTITVVDVNYFSPAGSVPATIEYIIWNRTGHPSNPAHKPTTIFTQGTLGPHAPGMDDPRSAVVDDWLHRFENLNIVLPDGDYYFTIYGAGGSATPNAAWFVGADLQAEDLEWNGSWRQANLAGGFQVYNPPNIVAPPEMADPEDRLNTSFTLWRQLPPPPPPPANDTCATAEVVTLTGAATLVSGTTLGSTSDTGTRSCWFSEGVGRAVWYQFTGNGSTLNITMCGFTSMDTVLHVYTGSCGSNLYCAAGDDDGCGGTQPQLDLCTTAGTTYYVAVTNAGTAGTDGAFEFVIQDMGACTPPAAPANDTCAGAVNVAIGSTVAGTIENATIDVGAPNCGAAAVDEVEGPGVWYTVVGNGQTLTATMCTPLSTDPHFDSKLNVYTGACNNLPGLTCVAYNDDGCSTGPQDFALYSVVSWCAAPGVTYRLLVHEFFNSTNLPGGTFPNQPVDNVPTFTLTITSDGVPCGQTDCDSNGTGDADQIAANPALDCFTASAPPVGGFNTVGGPNGSLDACECPANFNRDAAVGTSDISAFLSSWFNDISTGQTKADINCSGSIGTNDVSTFLSIWFAALNGQPSYNNCP